MDQLSTLQTQISNQLTAINSALQSGGVPATVATGLTSSAATLQAMLDKLVLGNPLTAADQQAMQNELQSSQAALLAAQSHRDGQIILVLAGIAIVGLIAFLIIRHLKRPKK